MGLFVLSDLQKLHTLNQNEQIPTLGQVLSKAPPEKHILIEIKGKTAGIVSELSKLLKASRIQPKKIFIRINEA